MGWIYEAADPNNPAHKGKTFIYDVSTKDIDTLQTAMMIVHEDNNYLYTLLEDLRGIAEVASTALDKPGGSDWPLLLDYHNEIAMLWSKIHKLNVEQWDIEAACRKELADLLIWLAESKMISLAWRPYRSSTLLRIL